MALLRWEAAIKVREAGALARDISFAEHDSSMPLPPGTGVTLVPGNHIYVPATASGTLTAMNPVSCILVGLDFSAIDSDSELGH